MAIQQENRYHLGVKIGLDGTILARSALVASVVRESPGSYLMTMSEGVGVAEEVHSLQFANNGKIGALGTVQRVSDTQYRILTYDDLGASTDQLVYFNMHRISNSNGL